jgi:hypothetical protein
MLDNVKQAMDRCALLLDEGWSPEHCVVAGLHMLGLTTRLQTCAPDLFVSFAKWCNMNRTHCFTSLLPLVVIQMVADKKRADAEELAYRWATGKMASLDSNEMNQRVQQAQDAIIKKYYDEEGKSLFQRERKRDLRVRLFVHTALMLCAMDYPFFCWTNIKGQAEVCRVTNLTPTKMSPRTRTADWYNCTTGCFVSLANNLWEVEVSSTMEPDEKGGRLYCFFQTGRNSLHYDFSLLDRCWIEWNAPLEILLQYVRQLRESLEHLLPEVLMRLCFSYFFVDVVSE